MVEKKEKQKWCISEQQQLCQLEMTWKGRVEQCIGGRNKEGVRGMEKAKRTSNGW